MDLKITSKHLLLALAGWAFALSAAAQYQWIGKDGRKVFSDRPPPADVQEKDILRQPGSRRAAPAMVIDPGEATEAAAATPAATAGKTGASLPKISGKDAELQAKKKKLEEEEAAKKKAEEEKAAKSRADNCERAKKAVGTLQSGVRMSTTNAKGEREFMDDAARAAEARRLQAIVESECRPAPPQ